MTETIVSAKRPYDPGKPQAARLVNQAEGLYAIDSFRGESRSYLVNLKKNCCSCPAFARKGDGCKHLLEVRRQARFIRLLAIARAMADADLTRLLVKHTEGGDVETAGAIRCVRAERKAAAAAPPPPAPPVGSSVKIYGPTDADVRLWL